jgi:hypothetical protein
MYVEESVSHARIDGQKQRSETVCNAAKVLVGVLFECRILFEVAEVKPPKRVQENCATRFTSDYWRPVFYESRLE